MGHQANYQGFKPRRMLKTQLTSAYRKFLRHKFYGIINISGFVVCLSSLIFIYLHIMEETGFDLHHTKADRIYRLLVDTYNPTNKTHESTTGFMVAESLKEYPEIENVTRIWNDYSRPMSVVQGQEKFIENHIYFTDTSFFDVFDIEMVSGDGKKALSQKNGLILSEETAQKYFGKDDPLGKRFTIVSNESSGEYVVSGIAKRFPKKSHFNFDFLASTQSIDMWWKKSHATEVVVTYLTVNPETNIKSLEEKIQVIVATKIADQLERWYKLTYDDYVKAGYWYLLKFQPLKEIYLHSYNRFEVEPLGSVTELRIIALIGLFILILGIINYINLATAGVSLRIKEIGIRTIMGSTRKSLAISFLIESIFLSTIGLVIALLLCSLLLPRFNDFANHDILYEDFFKAGNLAAIVSFSLLLGVLAGLYPAIISSKVLPTRAIKGLADGKEKGFLRNTLVVIQFSVSVFLISATLVVGNQLRFIQSQKLGFDQDNIIVIDRSMADLNKLHLFNESIQSLSGVKSSGVTSSIGEHVQISTPFSLIKDDPETLRRLSIMKADHGYLSTMNLHLVEGRWFSNEFKSDSMHIILNKTAVKALGLESPVGTEIHGWLNSPHTIVGVVEDFHTESLHSEIKPLGILSTNIPWPVPFVSHILVKTASGTNFDTILSGLKSKWDQTVNDRPFKFKFLDDHLNSLYEKEQQTADLFKIFGGIAILIGCLGLFALVTFVVNQRLNEIGIRKVLGANLVQLYQVLSVTLARPVLIAIIIAIPTSMYLSNYWLENFAYRIRLTYDIPLFTIALTFGLVVCTISYTIIKAALKNPIDILKDE